MRVVLLASLILMLLSPGLTAQERLWVVCRGDLTLEIRGDDQRALYNFLEGAGWCGNSYRTSMGGTMKLERLARIVELVRPHLWWSDQPPRPLATSHSKNDRDDSTFFVQMGDRFYCARPDQDPVMAQLLTELAEAVSPEHREALLQWAHPAPSAAP